MSLIDAAFHLSLGGFRLDAEFTAPPRGVTALFGPSGSGKSTLLRCIAGLERAEGRFHIGDETWQDTGHFLPPHRRSLGYVFQEASLLPHLSVPANLEYGYRRIPVRERRIKPEQVIDWLGVAPLLGRRIAALSGGERQRVAIGRALLASPRLLLMDEPLSALDRQAKQEILPYLESLQRELDIPVLYVSHALDEVARLADHLVLIERGRIIAAGPMTEMATRLDLTLAHGGEAEAIVDGKVAGHDEAYHLTYVEFPGGRLTVPRHPAEIGQPVRIRILARDVSLTLQHQEGTSILNILPVTVTDIMEDSPAQMVVRLDAAGTPLLARITKKSACALAVQAGRNLYAQVKSVAILE
jgi:molybdate transport system ATP-binding protein